MTTLLQNIALTNAGQQTLYDPKVQNSFVTVLGETVLGQVVNEAIVSGIDVLCIVYKTDAQSSVLQPFSPWAS